MLDEAMVDMVTKAFSPDPPGTSISTLVGTQSSFTGLDGPTIPYNQHETPTTVVRTGRYADWSGLTPTGVLGQNSAGQPINVYVRNAAPNISEPRRVVIGTSIHGSENAGQFLVHELLYNTDLPDDVELIAIPEINKSGVPFSKRKNATGTDESNRSDITIGVDLNRNWDYNWSSAGSTDPTNKNYRGTEPESEPETKAVADFLRSLGKVDLFASFHANLDYVAPVGNTPIEVAVAYSSRSGMNVGNGRTQYVEQSGSMDAWFNSLTGSPTLLVELSSSDSRAYIHKQVNSMLEAIDALP